jgi:hypothetical protein
MKYSNLGGFVNNTVETRKRGRKQRRLENDSRRPEGELQAVERAFRSPRSRPVQVFATLVFDSFQSPVPGGVRGVAVGTRRLLYEATGVSIELNLDSLSATGDVLVTGQVVQPGDVAAGICQVPVQLLHGRKTIAQTQTNQFGEFHLKGEAGKGMQVSVGVTEQKDVFILLDDSIWRTPSS